MFSKSVVAAAAALSLIASTSALYDASSPANLAMYWGSGGGQKNLSYFCDQPSVDIIPIGFIDYFPQQTGGLPGEDFGNACWGQPYYPDSDGLLPERCFWLQENIPYCQKNKSKKIILSIGGGTLTYQLTGYQAGVDFAYMLWNMYGPYNASYVAGGGVRPLDRGYSNVETDPYYQIDVDGFDFDIELASTDASAGYIGMIQTLRALFLTNPCKEYMITGAPQCAVDTGVMDEMIQGAKFDALWIQYYNTPACSARTWVKDNTAFNSTDGKTITAQLTYDSWVDRTSTGLSKDAKLYLGLLGSPGDAGSALSSNDFLWPTEATNLIDTYVNHTRFGGVMIWEATGADEQYVQSGASTLNYYDFVKSVLNQYAPKTTAPVVSLCPSTTSSSSSASKTSTTSTTSKSSTTSTTSKSSTTSATSSSTSSSKTSSSTSSSLTSTSSKATSSSSSLSSSSVSSSPSSSSLSSTSCSSSSSQSTSQTPISSPSSTSASSTVASSSSSSSTVSSPTSLPSDCTFEGCWTEGNGVRALPALSYVDYDLMSESICYDFCVTQNGYPLFGLEYGGECWCGLALDQSSQNVTGSGDCSMPCGGTPDEFCGNGNRLDVYYCGTGTPSLPTSSQSSSSAAPTSSVPLTSASSTSVPPTTSPTSSSSSCTTTSESSTSSSGGVTTSQLSSTPSISPSSSYSQSSSSSSGSSSSSETPSSTSQSTSSSTQSSSGVTSSGSSSVPVSSPSSVVSSSSTPTPTSSPATSPSTGYSSPSGTPSSSGTVSSPATSPSTGYSSPSGTPSSSGNVSSPCTNSTTVTPTQSPSGSSSSSGVLTTPSLSSSESSSGVVSTPSVSSSNSGVLSTPSSSATSQSSGVLTTASSSVQYTTSTKTETRTSTISECAATVTNCPYKTHPVTTVIVDVYTTYCPVEASETSKGVESTPSPAPPAYTPMTTSTVYTTKIYTITSCAATVTNCPAKLGQVTTEIISLYTTVCPVTEATSTPAVPGGVYQQSSSAGYSTTTISSTLTTYRTVKVVKSTATVVPTPKYPTGPASSGGVVGTGTGLPSVSLVYSTVGEEATSAAGGVTASSTPSPSAFKGAASKMGGGSMVAVVLAAIVALIV